MADILIAAAILHHVNLSNSLQSRSFITDYFGFPQLVRKRKDRDRLSSDHTLDHALLRIVRLTIETNVMTSKYILDACMLPHLTHVQPLSVLFQFLWP